VETVIREIALYEEYVKEGSCVIDFGAKNGMRTLVLSQLVGERGKVIAFESRPQLFKEMYWNMLAARVSNVELYCVPFWEKEQQLDAFYFENVSLLRIDASGREDIFLKGAIGTILKCRPVLIVNLLGGIPVEKVDYYVEQELTRRLETLHKMGYTTERLEKSLYLALPKGFSHDY
jgi:predicted O-methyltransferase YrrM